MLSDPCCTSKMRHPRISRSDSFCSAPRSDPADSGLYRATLSGISRQGHQGGRVSLNRCALSFAKSPMRAGDKGDTSQISVIAHEEGDYAFLAEHVTAERVRAHFTAIMTGEVMR